MNIADDAVVSHQIVVDASIERAFAAFVEQFGDFKPPEHNLLGAEITETRFEPRVGGHIYDRAADGSECRWARVLTYEPPGRVVFSWDISPQWQLEADEDNTSEVEVRFVAETPTRTPAWSSNTAALIATGRAGNRFARVWMVMGDGPSTWRATRPSLPGIVEVTPLTTSIEVNRSAEEVFAYATDPSHFSEWQMGVVDGQSESSDTPQVGDRCLPTRRIGRADRTVASEIVCFDPPHRWGVRGLDGPIRAIVDVTVEVRSDTSANLTIALDFAGRGIGRILVPLLVRREAEREMPVNVTALKQHLEGSA